MKGMLSFFLSASSGLPFSVEAVCKSGCCPGVKGIAPENLLNLRQRRATAEHGGGSPTWDNRRKSKPRRQFNPHDLSSGRCWSGRRCLKGQGQDTGSWFLGESRRGGIFVSWEGVWLGSQSLLRCYRQAQSCRESFGVRNIPGGKAL